MSETGGNLAEYTVSEISAAVKRTIEDDFGYVRVRGEVSGYRGPHASGHAYFSLKDDRARIEAVIWKTTFQRLKVRPEEGMEVVAAGKLTTFPGASKYQLVIESVAPAGVGALMALIEERRRTLAAEGLFDEARKRPLPFLPRRIGVVTSPTGAVIRDILHRLADRFPVDVLVWPVRVQGEGSAAEVAAAIAGFGRLPAPGGAPAGALVRPDVIIVARGGGSLEDLWGFNDEAVVRAAAASPVPLISAVGHETDWTLIDHAADRRAPTPTAAAEMAVPVRSECLAAVAGLARRGEIAIARTLEQRRAALRAAARALPEAGDLAAVGRQRLDLATMRLDNALQQVTARLRQRLVRSTGALSPAGLARFARHERDRAEAHGLRLERATVMVLVRREERFRQLARGLQPKRVEGLATDARRRLGATTLRFERAAATELQRRAASLAGAAKLLVTLGYRSVLARGYALVRDTADRPVRSATALAAGEGITIEFADGRIAAVASGAIAAAPKRPRRKGASEGQGDLF